MSVPSYRDRLADQTIETEIASDETVFSGFRTMKSVTLKHASLAGGSMIGPVSREYVAARPAAVILAYDPARDALIVIRQFRIGAEVANGTGAALELPAGLVDGDEGALAAAKRELGEETGLRALAAETCFSILSSAGVTDEKLTFVLALVDSTTLPERAGLAAEDEDIRPIAAPVDDLLEAVDGGRLQDGHLVTGLNWFVRRGRARAQALAASLDPADA